MFTSKRFRYGTFSTLMMLFAVILFVLVNLVAGEFNRNRDMTREQIFSLSSQSRNFLSNINQEVNIFTVSPTGQEHVIISQLLVEYSNASSLIRVQNIDPALNPGRVLQFAIAINMEQGIPDGSVIVQSGTHVQVITPQEMVTVQTHPFTGETRIVSWNFEREITRAIHQVTTAINPIIYYVTGSGEDPIPEFFRVIMENENFILRDIDLVVNSIPEDAEILIIPDPTRDWTAEKANRIRQFLANEGRAIFMMENSFIDTPNIDSVLAAYGISLGEYFILEGDRRNMFANEIPFHIIPTPTGHEILTSISDGGFQNLLVSPAGIEISELRPASTTIEPLWITSNLAFGRVEMDELSLSQVPSDVSGPFNLAIAVTDSFIIPDPVHSFVERTTQFVVVGSGLMLRDEITFQIGMGNYLFVINSINWLLGQPPSIFVPARTPAGTEPLTMTAFQANIITGVAIGLIPLLILSFGVVIWLKRKNS